MGTQAVQRHALQNLREVTPAVFKSPASLKLLSMIKRVAPYPHTALILGETGSGKELIARSLHCFSLRNNKPFVDVNCAALPEHLIESELFGYEKGAFSGADHAKAGFFEQAAQGTLFLDEIGELDPRVQVKLLRVLDDVPYYRLGGNTKIVVDVRVVAATNRDLEEEVKAGRFRRDLYHRLSQIQLRVPALRERPEDIEALASYFLQQHRPAAFLSSDALAILKDYSWPGNIRELRNVISKLVIMSDERQQRFEPKDLPEELSNSGTLKNVPEENFSGALEDMEQRMIIRTIQKSQGNLGLAAQQLGISRRTLSRKLKMYGDDVAAKPAPVGSLGTQMERYFRASLSVEVEVRCEGVPIRKVTAFNVSSRGIGVVGMKIPPKPHETLFIEFRLPGVDANLKAEGALTWMDNSGRAGIEFLSVHPHNTLDAWLHDQMMSEGWNGNGRTSNLESSQSIGRIEDSPNGFGNR